MDTNTNEKLTRRERRKRWKAAKKARRAEQKAYYQYAPWPVRIWNLYLKKPLKVIVIIAVIFGLLGAAVMTALPDLQTDIYYALKEIRNKPVDKEKIYELSPIDEAGAARIDAAASPIGADETWTICVYLVGADLEDMNENDLSYLTRLETKDAAEAIKTDRNDKIMSQLWSFTDDLKANGLEMPSYFYYPVKPVASSTAVTDDVVVAEIPGAASTDIGEMTSGVWSDKVQIVIQTGGARRWSNQLINPNRTQRFLYKDGQFSEIENLPLQPSYEPETLAEFLEYCRDNYPSDHRMLVLWNHGGGAFGYGNDSIIGGSMSLKNIREALSSVYSPDINKPAFDIIGFDACLMSSLEVTHALDGFASYYTLSEEVEPGDGWDYGPWLQAMTDDPTLSAPQIGRAIADSYMDFYMTQNVNLDILSNDVTFAVLDAKKCAELYDAYCDLARAQLIRAADDISVLSEIGRCSDKSTHYCSFIYDVYNTVDLANYVDHMVDSFPEECSRVKNLIGEAVLYHRENGSLSDSEGISVYLPARIRDFSGMGYFLEYVNDIAEDDTIRALYYYKVAGCLNDELKKHLATLTDVKPKTLNTTLFRQFSRLAPEIVEDGFSIPVGEELQSLMQGYEMETCVYDRDNLTITYYGRENTLRLDGEGNLVGSFDGQWICLDGVPLAVEVASSSASSVEYRAKVLCDGKESYLVFDCDRDTGEFSINGIREIPDPNTDGINYLTVSRSMTEIKDGSKIIPVYVVDDLKTNQRTEKKGETVKLTSSSRITRKALPNGYYLCSAVITDQRGESYYSAVVGHTVSGGKVSERKVDTDFYGRDY